MYRRRSAPLGVSTWRRSGGRTLYIVCCWRAFLVSDPLGSRSMRSAVEYSPRRVESYESVRGWYGAWARPALTALQAQAATLSAMTPLLRIEGISYGSRRKITQSRGT